jgi:hypothetical protein
VRIVLRFAGWFGKIKRGGGEKGKQAYATRHWQFGGWEVDGKRARGSFLFNLQHFTFSIRKGGM